MLGNPNNQSKSIENSGAISGLTPDQELTIYKKTRDTILHSLAVLGVLAAVFGALLWYVVTDSAEKAAERSIASLKGELATQLEKSLEGLRREANNAQQILQNAASLQLNQTVERTERSVAESVGRQLTDMRRQLESEMGANRGQTQSIATDVARDTARAVAVGGIVEQLIQSPGLLQRLQAEISRVAGGSTVVLRSIQQSQIFETEPGPPRGGAVSQDIAERYDTIRVPSSRYPAVPSITLLDGQSGLLTIDVSAGTSYMTGQTLGIGFGLEVLVNGQRCLTTNDQATLQGNEPAISASCTVKLLSGSRNNTIVVRRYVHGAGFIADPNRSFLRARYTLMTFSEASQRP